MIAVITGDIVKSRHQPPKNWMDGLKRTLSKFGKSPGNWEIYRGDEFQLEIKNPEEALAIAIQIKAYLKSIKMDVRMSLGIGDKTYTSKKISESNGSAFMHSGELFETLKKQKINLAINSGAVIPDDELNLMLRLTLSIMDKWLPQSAEITIVTIENPTFSQEEIGIQLGINQAAVSRRRKRAYFDLIMDVEAYYRKRIKTVLV
jgi:hypothetical protein